MEKTLSMGTLMKKRIFGVLIGVFAVATIFVAFAMANANEATVISNNVAGSYVDYTTKTYIDWSTGIILQNKFMYKYYGSNTAVTTGTYKTYLYSYKGPTPMEHTITVETGVKRTTSVTASGEYKWFKLAASYSYEESKSKSVSQKYTFPGDNKTHTLYQTCTTIGKQGFVRREAYISTVKSYSYIWGVYGWDIQYNPYVRYTADDYANRQACDTVEKQYGTVMQ